MGDVKDTNKDKDSSKRKETYIGGEGSGLAVEDNSKIESKIVSKAKQSSNSKKEKGPLNSQRAIRVNYRRLSEPPAPAHPWHNGPPPPAASHP